VLVGSSILDIQYFLTFDLKSVGTYH
jgi:hypothetical protein